MAKSPLQHSHHIVPTATYVAVLVALTVLMLATIGASYVNFPGGVLVNNLIAIGIACIKAFLVIWFFMGIKWATKLTRLWAVTGFIVFPLMFIMFCDFFVRFNEVVPSWDGRPDPALPRVIDPVGQSKQPNDVDLGFRPRG